MRLPVRVRLADGRTFTGTLPARKHRALQLGFLHSESEGLVELTPGTRPRGGKVDIDRRKHACHYLPGGADATSDEWLERLLDYAARIVAGEYAYRRFDGDPREEAFVGVAPRMRPQGSNHAVAHARFLWVDVDKPGELPALWGLLAERPCHLLVESAGSGGMHAYWQLAESLPAVTVDPDSGERIEWIKRANLRLIHRIGTGRDGRPSVADEMCAEQARLMRLAGTINYKTGRYARLVQVDLSLAPYSVSELVGDLADPPCASASSRRRSASRERRSGGSLPTHPTTGVLREAGRPDRTPFGLRPVPVVPALREDCVVPRVAGPTGRLVVLRVRGRWRDLRPGLVDTGRSDRAGAGPRGFQGRQTPGGRSVRTTRMSNAERFVVEVRENVTEALVEHEGHVYVSPPQDRGQALELVAVLLGHPASANGGLEQLWRQAIAGGQRSIKLRRVM